MTSNAELLTSYFNFKTVRRLYYNVEVNNESIFKYNKKDFIQIDISSNPVKQRQRVGVTKKITSNLWHQIRNVLRCRIIV